jgi:hypothetical protein
MPAGRAGVEMPAEKGGSTGAKAEEDLALSKRGPMLTEIGIPIQPDDICNFETGSPGIHG